MTLRRIHLAAGAVLAGLALTLSGCSDSGSTDAGKQPTQQSAPSVPTTSGAPEVDTAGDGSAEGFCAAVESGGGVDLGKWNQPQNDPELRAKLIKRFEALADAAPADLKPAMQDVAKGYGLVSSGKVSEGDQATITKFATAIQTLNKWLQTNCPNLKLPTAG
ncbi:hypothetical protein GCM10029976_096630 [Kribbella albertanoniae]|uniref:DUF732 domain-containing protein n=1 Tax=Kribbella albertanoniae TaxID=1266829 RepID=A0A4R4QFK1_9ACTN|nr:hypothetical protein [Kribbella albertanoniae]TDC34327.1 hypothetical protein E1261_04015 [Kribbella albertanoniae]